MSQGLTSAGCGQKEEVLEHYMWEDITKIKIIVPVLVKMWDGQNSAFFPNNSGRSARIAITCNRIEELSPHSFLVRNTIRLALI